MASTAHTTQILVDLCRGDRTKADRLSPLLYDELRALAARFMARERPEHTLQPTALVNEAFVRLIDRSKIDWKNRAHFFAAAAEIMRHVLVDHARHRQAAKRGGRAHKVTLTDAVGGSEAGDVNLLALDEALTELDALNDRQRRVVELRFFGGLTVDETAHVLEVSPQTVRLDWRMARAWLRQRLAT